MQWTRWTVLIGSSLGLGGCLYGDQAIVVSDRYRPLTRPESSYFCYDCHGYRLFDPYYDCCAYYGFRYAWDAHPGATILYRQRYVRIKENHPEYGRYRYRSGYRSSPRYSEGRDYENWRQQRPEDRGPRERELRGRRKGQEQTPGDGGR